MAWAPEESTLSQLAHYLKDSLNGQDPNSQRNAEQMLRRAKKNPDMTNYLAFLTLHDEHPSFIQLSSDQYSLARGAATLMLKNEIRARYKTIPDQNKQYIRSRLLIGLRDSTPQIRNHTASVIAEILRQGGLLEWPSILSELFELVENKSQDVPVTTQQATMVALHRICEDNKSALNCEYRGERPLDFLIPKLLPVCLSPTPTIASEALSCINVFISDQPSAITSNYDALLRHLFQMASSSHSSVLKQVCRAFVQLAEVAPNILSPHMDGLVDFFVAQQNNDRDPELALDAAEFWLCIGENANRRSCLLPFLPKVIPVLLESTVYSQEEFARLEAEEDDYEEEDREQDIKPNFVFQKSSRLHTDSTRSTDQSTLSTESPSVTPGLSEGEIEDSDEDHDEDLDPEDSWTLRKCSAAALDVLATGFRQRVFDITLPYLRDNLAHPDWQRKEAAVLALGAIADGCMDDFTPHLPELMPFLLSLLNHHVPALRQITCWALGRYSSWAAHLDPAGKRNYFEPLMVGLLDRMLDKRKRVQEAAASAFSTLEEKSARELVAYCPDIVTRFVQCFGLYKDRNIYILYDCIQTLAEHVGPALAKSDLVAMLLPALLARWGRMSASSREQFALLECLSYVVTALGPTFAPYAHPVWSRALSMIRADLEFSLSHGGAAPPDDPDRDSLVTALDLVSAMVQALPEEVTADLLANASDPPLFELLPYCLRDESPKARQSAYALMGDCAIYAFTQLEPALPGIVEILIAQMESAQHRHKQGSQQNRQDHQSQQPALPFGPSSQTVHVQSLSHQPLDLAAQTDPEVATLLIPVYNNACWTAGEILQRMATPLAPRLLPPLAHLLLSTDTPDPLAENAAVAIGRLCLQHAELVAPHLETLAPAMVRIMRAVPWTDEKGHAVRGFAKAVSLNPMAMEKVLLEFWEGLAEVPDDFMGCGSGSAGAGPIEGGSDMFEGLRKMFLQYRSLMPSFDAFLDQLPKPKANRLRRIYGLS